MHVGETSNHIPVNVPNFQILGELLLEGSQLHYSFCAPQSIIVDSSYSQTSDRRFHVESSKSILLELESGSRSRSGLASFYS